MKIIALAAAALMAVGTIGATPADAQYRGDNYRDGRSWNEGRDHDRGRGGDWDRRGRDERGSGWDRGRHRYGFDGGYHRGGSRVRCRTVRGYYGSVRRCFRIR